MALAANWKKACAVFTEWIADKAKDTVFFLMAGGGGGLRSLNYIFKLGRKKKPTLNTLRKHF